MDQAVSAVLAEYDARAVIEEARRTGELPLPRDERLLRVGPETATLMSLLVKGMGARAILEVGTSYGYSTVWLAEAARQTGGKVITLEMHANKVEYAREQVAKAGLAPYVDFRVGDARVSLAALSGPFEFVLLDLWKDLYIPCFDLFYPKLAPGAVIVADNMLHPEQTQAMAGQYRRHIRSAPGISSVLLAVGSGIEISRFRADP